MKILVVGAGAIGGYFGGRLLQAGRDVTFLVRERRSAQLGEHGLSIRSAMGDFTLPDPPRLLRNQIDRPFDVILVSCKSYDLADTMDSMAAAVGASTAILPVLNGLQHIDALSQRFGRKRVLGGQCIISSVLDEHGVVRHLNEMHALTFGELDGGGSDRVNAILSEFSHANFAPQASAEIMLEMWEKWVFIASAASLTCLMRASIGDVMAAGGATFAEALLAECVVIASENGYAPRAAVVQRAHSVLTTKGSPLTASMYKDMQRGAQTEADHVVGDLLRRRKTEAHVRSANGDAAWSPMQTAWLHLKTYEQQRSGAPA